MHEGVGGQEGAGLHIKASDRKTLRVKKKRVTVG